MTLTSTRQAEGQLIMRWWDHPGLSQALLPKKALTSRTVQGEGHHKQLLAVKPKPSSVPFLLAMFYMVSEVATRLEFLVEISGMSDHPGSHRPHRGKLTVFSSQLGSHLDPGVGCAI